MHMIYCEEETYLLMRPAIHVYAIEKFVIRVLWTKFLHWSLSSSFFISIYLTVGNKTVWIGRRIKIASIADLCIERIIWNKTFDCTDFLLRQSPRSQLLTARGCTVFSLMRLNATCSGTAGTARLPATSAAPASLTTGNPASACGLTRSQSAGMRVRVVILLFKQLTVLFY